MDCSKLDDYDNDDFYNNKNSKNCFHINLDCPEVIKVILASINLSIFGLLLSFAWTFDLSFINILFRIIFAYAFLYYLCLTAKDVFLFISQHEHLKVYYFIFFIIPLFILLFINIVVISIVLMTIFP